MFFFIGILISKQIAPASLFSFQLRIKTPLCKNITDGFVIFLTEVKFKWKTQITHIEETEKPHQVIRLYSVFDLHTLKVKKEQQQRIIRLCANLAFSEQTLRLALQKCLWKFESVELFPLCIGRQHLLLPLESKSWHGSCRNWPVVPSLWDKFHSKWNLIFARQ